MAIQVSLQLEEQAIANWRTNGEMGATFVVPSRLMHLKNELFYLCVLLERAKVIMALKNSSHLEQNLKEDFSLRIMQF